MKKLLFLISLLLSAATFAADSFLPLSFEAQFTQIYISAKSGAEKKSTGVLQYKYPGRIYFEVKEPDQVLFISNLERSWYYTPHPIPGESGEVTISKSTDNPLLKFLDSLKSGLKNGKLYNVVEEKNKVQLTFHEQPRKDIGINQAQMFFGKAINFSDLQELLLVYPSGKRVTFKLTKINTKPAFKDESFVFKIPENTRISR